MRASNVWLAVFCVLGVASTALAEPMTERDEWDAQVTAAKARAQQYRDQIRADFARSGKWPDDWSKRDAGIDRARRNAEEVLNDSSLQRGDIVAMTDGLYLFVGKDDEGERSMKDFVLLRRSPPQ